MRAVSYVDKKIIVRKSVFAAAQQLVQEAESNAGVSPVHLAERKIRDCRASRDDSSTQFWRDVWTHLILLKQKDGEIQIIEDN